MWGGVWKIKVHLQLRRVKDVKGTGASAAMLVAKAGPLLNGVGESKAASNISHNTVASSLRYSGLDSCTTRQAKNRSAGHVQRVMVSKPYSAQRPVTSGVPPLLLDQSCLTS